MSIKTKDKFHKSRRIFTAGLLLFTLYSKTSIAVENPLENRYSSSIVTTQIINFLSQFFPVLHTLLENMLPKHVNDNQQLFHIFVTFKGEVSSSSGRSSVCGKYKNSQFSLYDLKPRLISANSSVSSPYLESSKFVRPLEPQSQNIDSRSTRDDRLGANLSHFYFPERTFFPFREGRYENFIPGNIKAIKQDFGPVNNQTKEPRNKALFSSYGAVSIKSKNLSSDLLTQTKENSQEKSFKSIDHQSKEQKKLQIKAKSQPVNELSIKSTVKEIQEHRLENRTEETVYVKTQSETTSRVDTLAEISKMSEFQHEKQLENKDEKRSEPEIKFNPDTREALSLEKEVVHTVKESSPLKPSKNTAPWTVGLSPERKRLSPLPPKAPKKQSLAPLQLPFSLTHEPEAELNTNGIIPAPSLGTVRLSQSKLRNDNLSINSIKELDVALLKKGLKLPKESGILLALQRLIKDQKLKVNEVQALVVKLSEQVNILVEKVYGVSIKEFETHIFELIQPLYHIEAAGNFIEGFKQIAKDVQELWRTKLLTDYIETKTKFKEQQPLPTAKEVMSLVDKVIMQRFEEFVSPDLDSQIKKNAIIIIKPTIQTSPLYGQPSLFSTEEKKAIFTQVFKLLVLDSSFNLPVFTNSRGNIDIDSENLKRKIEPYIILAIGQLYGPKKISALNSKVVEEGGNSTPSTSSAVSAEDVVKQLDGWLEDKLFESLPGNSREEKIDFWTKISVQNEELEKLKKTIATCKDELTLKELEKKVQEISKKTYCGIINTLFEELGSQIFLGSELRSQSALYRDVKSLIEDYLSPAGFPGVIETTEQSLRQPLKKTASSLAIYNFLNRNFARKKYVIRVRSAGTNKYVETPMLEVPKFVLLFSLPHWLALKDRLNKRDENNKLLKEKAKLKKQLLVKKLGQLFFKEELQDISKFSGKMEEEEKENLPRKKVQPLSSLPLEESPSKKQNSQADLSPPSKKHVFKQKNEKNSSAKASSPLKPFNFNSSAIPLPPPPALLLTSRAKSVSPEIKIRQDLHKVLKEEGLTVDQESALIVFLTQYTLHSGQTSTVRGVQKFLGEFKNIFYRALRMIDEKKAYENFASQLGLENSNPFVLQLNQRLHKELQNHFLKSLTAENVEAILASGFFPSDSLKRLTDKIPEITRTLLQLDFKEALKQFKIETEHTGKDFENLANFLKEEALKDHAFSNKEKSDLVFGALTCMLGARQQDRNFSFPTKKSEHNKNQLILDIEALKAILVEFLNKVITRKYEGKQPPIKIVFYDEEIKPSKVLPSLGNLFLNKAFDILPGATQALKINYFMETDLKQSDSLIDKIMESLLMERYQYQATATTESTIVFTPHIIKSLKESIKERYPGFAAALDGNCRRIISDSVDPFMLFSSLLKGQLGANGNTPKRHRILMSSNENKDKKVETEEVITNFDIFLSMPKLWQTKRNLEAKKQREAEEQRLKELAMTHRIQNLQNFIQAEIEIQS